MTIIIVRTSRKAELYGHNETNIVQRNELKENSLYLYRSPTHIKKGTIL